MTGSSALDAGLSFFRNLPFPLAKLRRVWYHKEKGSPLFRQLGTETVTRLHIFNPASGLKHSPELLDKEKMNGVPLMISEHRFIPGTLTDRKGAKYSVEYDETARKSYIFSV